MLPELRKIEAQRVAFVQGQLRGRIGRAKTRREIAIDFDRRDALCSGDEIRGERGQAGTDLDNVIAELWIYRVKNPRDVMRIDEKILTEAAPGDMPAPFEVRLHHYRGDFRRAMAGDYPLTARV